MLNCYLLTQTVLLMKRKSENVYEEFFKQKDLFDFSNYSKDSRFLMRLIKKVIGKMKDEFVGIMDTKWKDFKVKNIN